jgi:hypothetical protein
MTVTDRRMKRQVKAIPRDTLADDPKLLQELDGRRTTINAHGLTLAIYKGPNLENDAAPEFYKRDIGFVIRDEQKQPCAAGSFVVWQFKSDDAFPELEHFLLAVDSELAEECQLAMALRDGWQHHEEDAFYLFDYGDIVHFKRLRIDATSDKQREAVWSLIKTMIDRLFRGRKLASLMMLHPHPLQYGSSEYGLKACKGATAKLFALYGKRLGAQRLDIAPEWMWIRFGCDLEPTKHATTA